MPRRDGAPVRRARVVRRRRRIVNSPRSIGRRISAGRNDYAERFANRRAVDNSERSANREAVGVAYARTDRDPVADAHTGFGQRVRPGRRRFGIAGRRSGGLHRGQPADRRYAGRLVVRRGFDDRRGRFVHGHGHPERERGD
jgi:hypothetical protein